LVILWGLAWHEATDASDPPESDIEVSGSTGQDFCAFPGSSGPGGRGPATKTYLPAAIDIEKYVKPVETGGIGGEGLTPGFWKTHSSYGPAPLAGWPQTHYRPDASYNTGFGVSVVGSPTLLQALGTGGGVNALLRHSTAALLNADTPNIDYAYTVAQVMTLTKAAIESGDAALIEAAKNQFAVENEKGADLTPTGTLLMTPAAGFGCAADDPTGPVVPIGSTVQLTFVVTNPGEVPVANVVVTDNNETTGTAAADFNPTPVLAADNVHNVGDDNGNNLLDPGEVWLYTWTKTVTDGQHTNIATVTSTAVDGPHSDSDAANWTGYSLTPDIDIEKTTNGPTNSNPTAPDYDNEDEADGDGMPVLAPGSTVTWTYKVTNTGNVPFAAADIKIVDDNGTPDYAAADLSTAATGSKRISYVSGDTNNNGYLDLTAAWIYTATGVVQNLAGSTPVPGAATAFTFSGGTATYGPPATSASSRRAG
jgi:hypothetical protein